MQCMQRRRMSPKTCWLLLQDRRLSDLSSEGAASGWGLVSRAVGNPHGRLDSWIAAISADRTLKERPCDLCESAPPRSLHRRREMSACF